MLACDFFTIETIGLKTLYVLFFIVPAYVIGFAYFTFGDHFIKCTGVIFYI